MIDDLLIKLEKAWQWFLKELDTPEGGMLFVVVMGVLFIVVIPWYVWTHFEYNPFGWFGKYKK